MPMARLRGDQVYSQIKRQLAAGFLRFGDRIDIAALADQLAVSVTPVREALSRLFDEQLVQFAPTKGFSVRMLSAEELRQLYEWNMMLAGIALSKHVAASVATIAAHQPSKSVATAAAGLAHSPEPPEAVIAGNLFLRIASGSDNANLVRAVGNVNDRLAFLRTIELEVMADCLVEVTRLNDLYDGGRFTQMRRALIAYHRKRSKLVPELLKEALSRSFSSDP
ncbi:MAG: GntR family transcriptional regulator [Aliidongia sp.]